MLDVSIKEDNVNETQVVFVTLKGALDSEKAIDFYDFINAEIIKGFRKFVVDSSRLDYIFFWNFNHHPSSTQVTRKRI